MGKLSDIIVRDKIYAALFLFILAVNVFAFSGYLGEKFSVSGVFEDHPFLPAVSDQVIPERKKMFDPAEIEARQRRVEDIAGEDPILYFFLASVNMTIFFVILVGIMIDIFLAVRKRNGNPVSFTLAYPDKPLWKISDIVRVVIVFIFAGYMFAFLQEAVSVKFPILRNINFRMITDTAFVNIACVTVVAYFVVLKYGQGLAAMGLSKVRAARVMLAAGIGYAGIVPVLVGIMALTFVVSGFLKYEPPVQPIVEVFMEEKKISILWMSTLFASIFGPVAEEIFFRGFMYPAFRKKWGVTAAMLCVSAVFAVLHAHVAGFLPIMALGMLLVYLYEKTGSLFVPMAAHMIHNIGMVVLVGLMRAIGT